MNMVVVKQINNHTRLEMVPLRCFANNAEAARKFGILMFVNIGIDLVSQADKQEEQRFRVCIVNNLRIQLNKTSNELFLGSDRKDVIQDQGGKKVVIGGSYYFHFLPGNEKDDTLADLQEETMQAFFQECKQFILAKRQEMNQREDERFDLPDGFEDIAPKPKETASKSETPFD